MSVINQKEYLKKYLGFGKDVSQKKKKIRKKVRAESNRLTIIDDNIDTFNTAVQEDLLGESEDAPQIVEVIDDRPPSMRIDEKSNTHLWIPIGGNDDLSPPRKSKSRPNSQSTDGDMSPPRKYSNHSYSHTRNKDMSPPRKYERGIDDLSPPRKNSYSYSASRNKDISPPRKYERGNDDLSLTIKSKSNSNSQSKDEDMSPPRKYKSHSYSESRNKDISPPRKYERGNDDLSPTIKSKSNSNSQCSDEDMSPPRKYKSHLSSQPRNKDISLPRNYERGKVDLSPTRKRKSHSSIQSRNEDMSSERHPKKHDSSNKETKTLDGKVAGLQNAKQLIEENEQIQKREEELYKNMSSTISGADAQPNVRKTGRLQNLVEETEKDLEKKKKEDENKEKYSRWGRGLRQVEDATTKIAEELHEMNKPLARYANDEDLERYLKEQEREGDPMLAYIRKKKKKKDIEEGKPIKPMYMGEFMPNRYGIRPGHRWDGVDRSNGYEKRRFETINSKMALQEESYKWSTEDM